jgi:hypothetical protein
MGGEDWIDRLAAGSKYAGVAVIGLLMYRALTFSCNFIAGRYDARQQRVEALDEKVSSSLAKRLDHLERAERESQAEIQMLRGWVTALATELRAVDPENLRLKDLAHALQHGLPVPADHGFDGLLHQAEGALAAADKAKRGRRP